MTTRHPVSFSSIARMELTELPTHVKGAWQVTASRWPDRENKVNRHSPRSHCHCLTRSPTHPASIHSFTQHSSTDRGSIYLPRIQSKRRESVTCNLQPTSNQSCTDIINQQLTCGPRALCLPWPVKKSAWCTWYTYSSPITAHWAQYPIHQAVSLISAPPHLLQPTNNQSRLDIMRQRLTSGPEALDLDRS